MNKKVVVSYNYELVCIRHTFVKGEIKELPSVDML